MAELISQERLQPSLLDRLTDDEPGKKAESRDKRVLSLTRLRQGVLRDLAWLLNSTNLAATTDLSEVPHVTRSVLNYGIPEMAGFTSSSIDPEVVEGMLQRAIIDFEPRILPKTVKVKVSVSPETMGPNTLTLEITGELWAQPIPEKLFLKTQLDLESGLVSLADHGTPAPRSREGQES